MKEQNTKKARRTQTIAICSCLCLLAMGAGVGYRALQKSPLEMAQDKTQQEEPAQKLQEYPVTAVQSPSLDTALLAREQQSKDAGESPDAAQPKESKPKTQNPAAQNTAASKSNAEPAFAYPLEGELVLPYSIDHAIYDPTLEQYRTNESISLSAEAGTEVKAAADGKVKQIAADAQMGNTIIIEHTNGWLTTYGQLEDAVAVKEGETVQQGQVIGAVNAPTKYGVALGSHLDFAMEKDGQSVNPQEKLQQDGTD